MDNKFFLALMGILGAAVLAALAYGVCDALKWLAGRLAAGWRRLAMCVGAAHALPDSARGLVRIKCR